LSPEAAMRVGGSLMILMPPTAESVARLKALTSRLVFIR